MTPAYIIILTLMYSISGLGINIPNTIEKDSTGEKMSESIENDYPEMIDWCALFLQSHWYASFQENQCDLDQTNKYILEVKNWDYRNY